MSITNAQVTDKRVVTYKTLDFYCGCLKNKERPFSSSHKQTTKLNMPKCICVHNISRRRARQSTDGTLGCALIRVKERERVECSAVRGKGGGERKGRKWICSNLPFAI